MDQNLADVADESVGQSKRFDEEAGLDNPAQKDGSVSSKT